MASIPSPADSDGYGVNKVGDFTRSIKLMGGRVAVTIYDIDSTEAGEFYDDILEEVEDVGQRLQRTFDFFDPGSELSRLNRERELRVSKELAEVISSGLMFSEETGGRYDITFGRKIIARKLGEELPDTGCSYKDVSVVGRKVTLGHYDAMIDLGSIAKGYAVDRLVDYMIGIGIESGFVDARGDMRVFGRRTEEVAIQHPREHGRTINPFTLREASAATSGDYNQYYGSFDRSHIVGDTDFCSVTVVSESCTDADAIASCVFLMGSVGALDFLRRHKEARVFAMDRDLKNYSYNGFQDLLVGEE
jgi:FAD:protein FMN transferase